MSNFHLPPPPKMVDGLLAVPIDIASIAATFTFDGTTQTAAADATISYEVGPTAGNPIFDLRQTVTQAWLDGAPFPIAQLAHHDFGSGPFTNLRVIEAVQPAGSVHTLRVQYSLAVPDSQLGGSYLPALTWSAGPRLTLVFGLSDLNRARYAEAWLPANLLFDQYSIDLEVRILNTLATHSAITNGTDSSLGLNHWQIGFPARFTASSPMLEIRASDQLVQQSDTMLLPVSGNTVTIEGWKPTGSAVNLTTEINNIKALLTNNENNYGPYVHGSRFVAFFNGSGGMEYEGGTTTSTGALGHEVFHSWFGRGIKPASQADGWWDEGFTSFHDDGANDAVPFDFTAPPVLLCSRDPWQRHTPGNSYSDGSDFWKGMASLLGVANLLTRTDAESFRVSLVHRSKDFFRSGNVEVQPFKPSARGPRRPRGARLECGGYAQGSGEAQTPELVLRYFESAWEAMLPAKRSVRIPVELPALSQTVVGLKITALRDAQEGKPARFHLVQRDAETQRITGGVAVEATIRDTA